MPSNRKGTRRTGIAGGFSRGCAILFGIPFAAAGIFCWAGALFMCAQFTRVGGWEQIGARMVKPPGPEGLEALVYEYRWEGRAYYGNGKDGVTRFLRQEGDEDRLRRDLEEAARSGNQLTVWVNPRRPEQSAVLPPEISLLPLFLGIFVLSHGGAGFGIIGAALASSRMARRRAELASHYPDEPWKWREDWMQGRAEAGDAWWRWLMVWFAVGWGSIAVPVAASAFGTPEAGAGMRWGAIGGMVLGLLLGWACWYAFRRHRLASAVIVSLPEKGLRRGMDQSLELTDRMVSPLRVGQPPRRWTVRCRERITASSGGESSTRTEDRWNIEAEVTDRDGGRRRIRFAIPSGAPDTSAWFAGEDGVRWELTGKRSGEPEVGPFQLPVFGRSGSSTEVESFPVTESAGVVQPADLDNALAAEGILLRGRGVFYFPPRRHKLAANTSLILGIIFTMIGFAPWLFPSVPWPVRLFLLLFGLIGLFSLYFGLRQNFGELELQAGPEGLRLRKMLFGWHTVSTWQPSEIKRVRVMDACSFNDVPFYSIVLEPARGLPKVVTPLFRHRPTAEAMREIIEALAKGRDPGARRQNISG